MGARDFDIAALQALSEEEWARLEARYHDRIYGYARRQVGHPDVAEDLAQEVFLGALRGIANFDQRYNIEQFLMGIARNKVIDHLRRNRPEINVPDRDDDSSGFFSSMPADTPASSQLAVFREKIARQRTALTLALKEMVAELRDKGDYQKLMAIELCFLTNRRHRDIARRLGIDDEKAIAGIKFRAIRDLQGRLRRVDPRKTLFSGLWGSI